MGELTDEQSDALEALASYVTDAEATAVPRVALLAMWAADGDEEARRELLDLILRGEADSPSKKPS